MKLPAILFIAASSIAFTACDDVRVEKYPNGNVRFEATYVNDKKEGPEKEYYDDGTLKRSLAEERAVNVQTGLGVEIKVGAFGKCQGATSCHHQTVIDEEWTCRSKCGVTVETYLPQDNHVLSVGTQLNILTRTALMREDNGVLYQNG